MKSRLLAVLGVAVLAWVLPWPALLSIEPYQEKFQSDPPNGTAEVPPVNEHSSSGDLVRAEPPGGGHAPGAYALSVDDGLLQTWQEPGFKQYADIAPDSVGIVDQVIDSLTGQSSWRVYRTSPAFTVHDVGFGSKDNYAVGGVAPNGDIVIETWRLETSTPILSGGAGAPQKSVVRREVFRGDLGQEAGIPYLGYDIDLRFVIALVRTSSDGATRAYRFENQVGAVPVSLIDPHLYPEIDGMRYVRRAQHAVLGRTWYFDDWPGFGTTRILFVDADNDGMFDGPPMIGDQDYFLSLGIMGDPNWWDPVDGSPPLILD